MLGLEGWNAESGRMLDDCRDGILECQVSGKECGTPGWNVEIGREECWCGKSECWVKQAPIRTKG